MMDPNSILPNVLARIASFTENFNFSILSVKLISKQVISFKDIDEIKKFVEEYFPNVSCQEKESTKLCELILTLENRKADVGNVVAAFVEAAIAAGKEDIGKKITSIMEEEQKSLSIRRGQACYQPVHSSASYSSENSAEFSPIPRSSSGTNKDIIQYITESLSEMRPAQEILNEVKKFSESIFPLEQEILAAICKTLMDGWSLDEVLGEEQRMKTIDSYTSLIGEFCQTPASELVLILCIDEFCTQKNIKKTFVQILRILNQANVLSEEGIISFYNNSEYSQNTTGICKEIKLLVKSLQSSKPKPQ